MSVPCSLRVGPFTSNILLKKRYVIFYIAIIWLSFIPILMEFWLYWRLLWNDTNALHFYLFLPLFGFLAYTSLVFSALIIAKVFLMVVNVIHKPKEGVFERNHSDKDYRYWNIRLIIKKYPVWISHKFPFPFLDNICFKLFGVKTKFSNSLFEGWVDTEFIEFGKNVIVGQASIIQSSVIIGNLLILKKVVIKDNVRIGAHSVVMPGTFIDENSVLAAHSLTTVEQHLEKNWIYVGIPAEKFKINRFNEDDLEDLIELNFDVDGIREKYEKLYERGERTQVGLLQRRKEKEAKIEQERQRWQKIPS
jgi:carbonic anhydrase/acetyltransferase-like protein (isoleucine patch superfamily)